MPSSSFPEFHFVLYIDIDIVIWFHRLSLTKSSTMMKSLQRIWIHFKFQFMSDFFAFSFNSRVSKSVSKSKPSQKSTCQVKKSNWFINIKRSLIHSVPSGKLESYERWTFSSLCFSLVAILFKWNTILIF